MKIVENELVDFIISNLPQTTEKNVFILSHILSGGSQATCVFEGKRVNPNIIGTARTKYIPYVEFRKPLVLIKDNCPQWLSDSEQYKAAKDYQRTVEVVNEKVEQPKLIAPVGKNVMIDFDGSMEKKFEEQKTAAVNRAIENTTKKLNSELEATLAAKDVAIDAAIKDTTERLSSEYKAKLASEKELLSNQYGKWIEEAQGNHHKHAQELLKKQANSYEGKMALFKNSLSKLNKKVVDYQAEVSTLNSTIEKLKADYDSFKESSDKQFVDLTESSEKERLSLNAKIAALIATIEEMTPKRTKGFYVQSFVAIAWLLGLVALSVFSIENMLIYFNAGSFYIVALILGVFMEFMLWATNIARFSGNLEDRDSLEQTYDLSLVIFIFRACANSLGGFYIAKNAVEYASKSGLFANFGTKFTDLKELYFGYDFGDNAIIATSIVIGLFVAFIEYRALPLAIKHAYSLFIEKIIIKE